MSIPSYKFLIKIVILFVLVAGCVESIHRIVVTLDKSTSFSAVLVDKHAFAASLPSPKILLVGGSGTIYCYNSDLLQKMSGVPVANMALLAPLGVRFILADVEQFVKKGDIVILSFELGENTLDGDLETQLTVADYMPDVLRHASLPDDFVPRWKGYIKHRLGTIQRVPLLFEKPTIADRHSIYFRGGFNKHGDIVSHENNETHEVYAEDRRVEEFNFTEELACINQYAGEFEKRGAKVFYAFPPLAESQYRNTASALSKIEHQFREELSAELIYPADEGQYSDTLFFDSVFHLKPSGRDHHTRKLIEGLSVIDKTIELENHAF